MNTSNLQRAIYTALTGNLALMAQINGVYATKPQDDDSGDSSAFPYVSIGDERAIPWDTKTNFGASVAVPIDIWSRSGNYIEAKDIGQAIWRALHHKPMTIAEANHTMTIMESAVYIDDPDGQTKHGALSFSVSYTDIT